MGFLDRLFGRKAPQSSRPSGQTAVPVHALDMQRIKANLAEFAKGGKTIEFLKESVKVRGSEIAELSAEVLVSEPAFAETLAEALASSHAPHLIDRGRAAHLLMRAIRRDPGLGNRATIQNSLRQVVNSADPFVSGNAQEALKVLTDASPLSGPPTSREQGQQERAAPSPAAATAGGKEGAAKADEAIAECKRWLADYQRRADIPGAKFDDTPEYIKCIERVGAIGTPEAIKVLEQVRADAMFADILDAAVSAMDQAKFGTEKPVAKCGRYLAQQEAWTTNFSGKPIENWEFGKCFQELKALNTPEAVEMLKKAAAADYLFPDARESACIALDQKPEKRAAFQGKYVMEQERFGPEVGSFLIKASALVERLILRRYQDETKYATIVACQGLDRSIGNSSRKRKPWFSKPPISGN